MGKTDDLIEQRQFDSPAVRKVLDGMDFGELVRTLQAPETRTSFAPGHGYWQSGDGRPSLADEEPAVMAAVARCALNRSAMVATGKTFSQYHPERCGWCEYPLNQLLRA